MSTIIKTNDLRKKLDGDELDLSLMCLKEIPVAEIAIIPKATKIDLTNNGLVSIPSSFATSLSHITKLELGSNKIRELPDNFGNLTQLKHLDLYNNQLSDLPLSLCHLKNLKYLDLKGNPLKSELNKVAGNCLNNKECQEAAKNVLTYLRKLNAEKEKQENYRQKLQEEKDMAKKKKEDEELAKKRAEKKAAKDKKRLELQKEKEVVKHNGTLAQTNKVQKKSNDVKKPKDIKIKKTKQWSCLGFFNIILFIVALAVGSTCAFLYAEGDLSISGLKAAWPKVKQNSFLLFNVTKEALKMENLEATKNTIFRNVQPFLNHASEFVAMGIVETRKFSNVAINYLRSGQLVDSFWELQQKFEWTSCIEGVRWSANFLTKQFLVLKEELLKNEAMTSLWVDMGSLGSSIWNSSLSISETTYKVSNDIQLKYFPIVKENIIFWYNYITNYVENLLK